MAAPFYAEYTQLFTNGEKFDDVTRQILLIDVHTRDPKTCLRYHAWDESNSQPWADAKSGCSPVFWGRAMGWYVMGLVDVLDFLPRDSDHRDHILFILNDLIKPIVEYQDQKSGLWFQILDIGNSDNNYLEASVSAMFTYALAKAVNKGYTNAGIRQIAHRAFEGIKKYLIHVRSNGLIDINNVCSESGLGRIPEKNGSFQAYMSRSVVSNNMNAIAPFIMASVQIEKLSNQQLKQEELTDLTNREISEKKSPENQYWETNKP
jgi:unsaturated rhamnogalacturonyl hydrolase